MSITATLFAQIVAFVLVVWMVNRLLWKPLSEALRKRQTEIADGLAAAEEGQRALRDADDKKMAIQKEAQQEAAEIVATAQKRANEIVEEAKTRATEEGERIKTAARNEIEGEYNRAKESLRKEVGSLAVAGASRILGREIDAGRYADEIKSLESNL